MNHKNQFILWFSLLYLYIVIMLVILQISKVPWFFLWLVLMHMGIIGLILLKKRNHSTGIIIRPIYKIAYGSLLLFTPILIYKLLGRLIGMEVNEMFIETAIIILIILAFLTGIINVFYYKKIN